MSKHHTDAKRIASSLSSENSTLTVQILKNGDGCVRNAVTFKFLFDGNRSTVSRSMASPEKIVSEWNGWKVRSAKVRMSKPHWNTNPEMARFLDQCTKCLSLSSSAQHLYTPTGHRVEDVHELSPHQLVYVSQGGPFIDPNTDSKAVRRRKLRDGVHSELSRMDHLKWLYGFVGSSPVLLADGTRPGAVVGLGTYTRGPQRKKVLKDIGKETQVQKDDEVKDYHSISHKKTDELHQSKQPFWKNIVETDQLLSDGDKSANRQQCTLPPSALPCTQHTPTSHTLACSTWTWRRNHLVLAHHPNLALATDKLSSGGMLVLEQFSEHNSEQLWDHTEEGFLLPCASDNLVLTLTGLLSRKPILKLLPRVVDTQTKSPLCQKWAELPGVDDSKFHLLGLSGSIHEECHFYSCAGEVCIHSLLGGAPLCQGGCYLTSTTASVTPTLVCSGCGAYLKRAHPHLLIEDLETDQVFMCSFWSDTVGKMKGLTGPLSYFAGKVDLSKHEIGSTLKRLNDIHWSTFTTAEEIRETINKMQAVRRLNVKLHQCGTKSGGVDVGVSTMEGLTAACEQVFAQPKTVGSIFLKDGSRVEKFKDILDTLSEAEDWIDVWVTARKEFVSVGDISTLELTQVWESAIDVGQLMSVIRPTVGAGVDCRTTKRERGSIRSITESRRPLRLLVYPCGSSPSTAQRVLVTSLDQLLEESTVKLSLPFSARKIFTSDGKPVTSLQEVDEGQPLAVAMGHKFFTENDARADINRKSKWARKHDISKHHVTVTDQLD